MPQTQERVQPPVEALCLGCNYPLRGLTSTRCPECGRGFDPADPWTMNTGRPVGRFMRWWLKPTRRWIDFWSLAAAVTLMWSRGHRYDPSYLVSVTLWLLLLVAWSVNVTGRWLIVRVSRQPRNLLKVDRPRRSFAVRAFLVGALVAGFHNDECFHADHYSIYGFGAIDHGRHVEQCPQMINAVHLVGNWYFHRDIRDPDF